MKRKFTVLFMLVLTLALIGVGVYCVNIADCDGGKPAGYLMIGSSIIAFGYIILVIKTRKF